MENKRRTSILKQTKGRLPLHELQLTNLHDDDTTATTTFNHLRRVSFGTKKIKEFVPDNASNAPWLSEYEEFPSSDSSHYNSTPSIIFERSFVSNRNSLEMHNSGIENFPYHLPRNKFIEDQENIPQNSPLNLSKKQLTPTKLNTYVSKNVMQSEVLDLCLVKDGNNEFMKRKSSLFAENVSQIPKVNLELFRCVNEDSALDTSDDDDESRAVFGRQQESCHVSVSNDEVILNPLESSIIKTDNSDLLVALSSKSQTSMEMTSAAFKKKMWTPDNSLNKSRASDFVDDCRSKTQTSMEMTNAVFQNDFLSQDNSEPSSKSKMEITNFLTGKNCSSNHLLTADNTNVQPSFNVQRRQTFNNFLKTLMSDSDNNLELDITEAAMFKKNEFLQNHTLDSCGDEDDAVVFNMNNTDPLLSDSECQMNEIEGNKSEMEITEAAAFFNRSIPQTSKTVVEYMEEEDTDRCVELNENHEICETSVQNSSDGLELPQVVTDSDQLKVQAQLHESSDNMDCTDFILKGCHMQNESQRDENLGVSTSEKMEEENVEVFSSSKLQSKSVLSAYIICTDKEVQNGEYNGIDVNKTMNEETMSRTEPNSSLIVNYDSKSQNYSNSDTKSTRLILESIEETTHNLGKKPPLFRGNIRNVSVNDVPRLNPDSMLLSETHSKRKPLNITTDQTYSSVCYNISLVQKIVPSDEESDEDLKTPSFKVTSPKIRSSFQVSSLQSDALKELEISSSEIIEQIQSPLLKVVSTELKEKEHISSISFQAVPSEYETPEQIHSASFKVVSVEPEAKEQSSSISFQAVSPESEIMEKVHSSATESVSKESEVMKRVPSASFEIVVTEPEAKEQICFTGIVSAESETPEQIHSASFKAVSTEPEVKEQICFTSTVSAESEAPELIHSESLKAVSTEPEVKEQIHSTPLQTVTPESESIGQIHSASFKVLSAEQGAKISSISFQAVSPESEIMEENHSSTFEPVSKESEVMKQIQSALFKIVSAEPETKEQTSSSSSFHTVPQESEAEVIEQIYSAPFKIMLQEPESNEIHSASFKMAITETDDTKKMNSLSFQIVTPRSECREPQNLFSTSFGVTAPELESKKLVKSASFQVNLTESEAINMAHSISFQVASEVIKDVCAESEAPQEVHSSFKISSESVDVNNVRNQNELINYADDNCESGSIVFAKINADDNCESGSIVFAKINADDNCESGSIVFDQASGSKLVTDNSHTNEVSVPQKFEGIQNIKELNHSHNDNVQISDVEMIKTVNKTNLLEEDTLMKSKIVTRQLSLNQNNKSAFEESADEDVVSKAKRFKYCHDVKCINSSSRVNKECKLSIQNINLTGNDDISEKLNIDHTSSHVHKKKYFSCDCHSEIDSNPNVSITEVHKTDNNLGESVAKVHKTDNNLGESVAKVHKTDNNLGESVNTNCENVEAGHRTSMKDGVVGKQSIQCNTTLNASDHSKRNRDVSCADNLKPENILGKDGETSKFMEKSINTFGVTESNAVLIENMFGATENEVKRMTGSFQSTSSGETHPQISELSNECSRKSMPTHSEQKSSNSKENTLAIMADSINTEDSHKAIEGDQLPVTMHTSRDLPSYGNSLNSNKEDNIVIAVPANLSTENPGVSLMNNLNQSIQKLNLSPIQERESNGSTNSSEFPSEDVKKISVSRLGNKDSKAETNETYGGCNIDITQGNNKTFNLTKNINLGIINDLDPNTATFTVFPSNVSVDTRTYVHIDIVQEMQDTMNNPPSKDLDQALDSPINKRPYPDKDEGEGRSPKLIKMDTVKSSEIIFEPRDNTLTAVSESSSKGIQEVEHDPPYQEVDDSEMIVEEMDNSDVGICSNNVNDVDKHGSTYTKEGEGKIVVEEMDNTSVETSPINANSPNKHIHDAAIMIQCMRQSLCANEMDESKNILEMSCDESIFFDLESQSCHSSKGNNIIFSSSNDDVIMNMIKEICFKSGGWNVMPSQAGKWLFSFLFFQEEILIEFALKKPTVFDTEQYSSLINHSVSCKSTVKYQNDRERDLQKMGHDILQLKSVFDIFNEIKTIEELPFALIKVHETLHTLLKYLEEVKLVLCHYPRSELRSRILKFRLFSVPLRFSFLVYINLNNIFHLSRSDIKFERQWGRTDFDKIKDIFLCTLHNGDFIIKFIQNATKHIIKLEEKTGLLTKRDIFTLLDM